MKTSAKLIFSTAAAAILLLGSGCVTNYAEQAQQEVYRRNRPAPDPRLQLGIAGDGRILVQYEEWRGEKMKACSRAFWLEDSQEPIAHGSHPAFLRGPLPEHLRPIPVQRVSKYGAKPAPESARIYAVHWAGGVSFSLFVNGVERARYSLPVYDSFSNTLRRPVSVGAAFIGDAAAGAALVLSRGPIPAL